MSKSLSLPASLSPHPLLSLYDLDLPILQSLLVDWGEPAYRPRQL